MNYYEELSAPMDVKVLDHNGFKYIAAADVRDRLNSIFDCKWSFTVVYDSIIEDTVVVEGRLEITMDDIHVVKESFGTGEIKRYNRGANEGKPLDLGNAYQTAVADALKSCAKMLGIGNKMDEGNVTNTPSKPRVTNTSSVSKEALIAKITNKTGRNPVIDDSEPSSPKETKEDIMAKLAEMKKQSSSKPPVEDSKDDDEVVDDAPTKRFNTTKSDVDSMETKLLILRNFASNKGMTPEEFIKDVYGDKVTLDNITEEQIVAILNGSIQNALKSSK